MEVTFVCISDTHSRPLSQTGLESADVLIHSGDFTSGGSLIELSRFANDLNYVKDKFDEVLITPGNHDFICQTDPCLAKSLFSGNIKYLVDESYEYKGIKLYFSPYSLMFCDWAFMAYEEDIQHVWNKIPEGTDILVTHGPAFGQLDETASMVHAGSKTLLDTIKRVKPKVHVFGHIHESYGHVESFGTNFINASVLNEMYKVSNKPIRFGFDTETKQVRFY